MKKYDFLYKGYESNNNYFFAKSDQEARKKLREIMKIDENEPVTLRKLTRYGVGYVNFKDNYDLREMKYPRKVKKQKQKQIADTFATICDTLFKSDQIMLMFEDEACVRVTAKMLENSLMRSDMPLFVKKTSQKIIRRYI